MKQLRLILLLETIFLACTLCQRGSVTDLVNQKVNGRQVRQNGGGQSPGDIDDIVAGNQPAADDDDEDIDKLIASVFENITETPNRISEGPGPLTNVPVTAGGGGGGSGIDLNPTDTGAETGQTVGDCECVPYYLCKNNTIITNGEGLLDIRMRGGPCKSYLDVCCKIANKLPTPITTPRPASKPTGCGQRNIDGVGFRITGDKDSEAQFGEFPWMVAILREEVIDGTQKLNVYQCGGSLIHPKVVLTAAHCVADSAKKKQLKIRAGEWDTQTKNELYPHQDRNVAEVIIHDEYYAGALFNDIALLILTEPVQIAENVDTVCLPPDNIDIDHTRCFASGWGKDVFGQEGRYQVILKKIELPIVPRGDCEKALRNTRLGHRFKLHESFVCAGGEPGKDTCKGDGGSPLVCPIKGQLNRYHQIGIVAWGIGCGEDQTPGVYVNVPLLKRWIDEQMVYKNIERQSYTL